MKTTVYHLITDTEEFGFIVQTFATEQQARDAAWELLGLLYKYGGFEEEDKPDPTEQNEMLDEQWDRLRADSCDCLWLEQSEVELPIT